MGAAAPDSVNRASRFRGEDDFYKTPPDAVWPLLSAADIPATFWEPACGDGAIAKVAEAAGHDVIASNLIDYGFGDAPVDFLATTELRAPCILTNPPFSLADEFLEHAWALGASDVFMLLRTKFVEGARRYDRIHRRIPMRSIYQFVERVKFYSASAPIEDQPGWNTEAFAWFHWQRGYAGKPELNWIRKTAQIEMFEHPTPPPSHGVSGAPDRPAMLAGAGIGSPQGVVTRAGNRGKSGQGTVSAKAVPESETTEAAD